MKNSKTLFFGVSVSIIAVSILFISLFLSMFFSMKKYSVQLENVYKEGLYQLVQNVDDLQVDMSKVIATSSDSSRKELLTNIRTSCTLAVSNLTVLPISSNKTSRLNRFFNLVSGYSQSLIDKINSGKVIDDDSFKTFEKLFDEASIVMYDLNNFVGNVDFDYDILDEVNISNGDDSIFSAGVASGDNPESELPTLIFDGPFAESVVAKEVKGLSEEYITKEECDIIANDLLKNFDGYELIYNGETNSKFETYNYVFSKGSSRLFVQFTKRGGLLLNILSHGGGKSDSNLSLEECGKLAIECANGFGFENLEVVWGAENGNIAYVNLAPVEKEVVIYPDLIKVKVDKSLGVVVGWDAVNYAYNHVERKDFEYSFNILEGVDKLSGLLKVENMRKAIIPKKYSGECCAYEYVCSWKDYVYYIYLDSITGEEIKIMRTVLTNSGELLL